MKLTATRARNPQNPEGEAPPAPRVALLLVGVCVCAVLTACSVEPPTPIQTSSAPRRREAKTPALEALATRSDETPYSYDPSGRRDPFKPLIEPAIPPNREAEAKPSCPPLQDFELASLKLVAIVWGDMGRKAMFKAPNGRGYAVSEEMRIGRQCGRIRRIDSNAVVIEETHQDSQGNVLKEEVVLRLREQEG